MFDDTTRTVLLDRHYGVPCGDFVLAGTGHRPGKLGGYNNAEVRLALTELAAKVIARVRPDYIISGMALGWDQALADAAVAHHIPFIAAVPFKGQESKWPWEAQEQYLWLLDQAEEVQIIGTPGYSAKKMQARNIWMVHQCTALAALWDSKENGGTWNCIRYARKVGKPCISMWKAWEELRSKESQS